MTTEGHKFGRDCIYAYRREYWEDASKDVSSSAGPFLPKCPHCKQEIIELVTMPVVVDHTNIPFAYMICCWRCRTVIHTINGTKDTYDGWLKEKEDVREKEERDDKLKDAKLLVNLDSVQLDREFVEDVLSIMSKEQLEIANEKMKSKLSGSDYQKYLKSTLHCFRKDE